MNTLSLLETIGGDASLRHASGDALAQRLAVMGASDALTQAARAGNSRLLASELGQHIVQNPNSPSQNFVEDDESSALDDDQPEAPALDDEDE